MSDKEHKCQCDFRIRMLGDGCRYCQPQKYTHIDRLHDTMKGMIHTDCFELTDEEILKTMVEFDVYSADDQCLIEAGRAILRKAQEK